MPRKPNAVHDLATRLNAAREALAAAEKERDERITLLRDRVHADLAELKSYGATQWIGIPPCDPEDGKPGVKLSGVHIEAETHVQRPAAPSVPIARVVPDNPGTKGDAPERTMFVTENAHVRGDDVVCNHCGGVMTHGLQHKENGCPAIEQRPSAEPGFEMSARVAEIRAKRGEVVEG